LIKNESALIFEYCKYAVFGLYGIIILPGFSIGRRLFAQSAYNVEFGFGQFPLYSQLFC